MGGKWPYISCLVEFCVQNLYITMHRILVLFTSSFFSMHLVSVQVVHPYSSFTQPQLERNPMLFCRRDQIFYMINNLLIVFHTFVTLMLTSFSEDEIWLPRYVNLWTNFRGKPLRVEMPPSNFKYVNSVLFSFM